jgi:hypothetical protein
VSQQLNLFNPIFLKQKKIFGAKPMLQALGVILLGVLGMVWFAGHRMAELQTEAERGAAALSGRQTKLNSVNVQFAPRQRSAALGVELSEAQAELASLHQVEVVLQGGALGNTHGYAEYFRAFARQNVPGLWLTGLTIVGAGNEIGVQGRAMQPTMIPNYVARLTAEKIMRGKTFASLKIERPVLVAPDSGSAAPAAPAPAPALAAAAAPAQAGQPSVQPVSMSPYVEFSLQSVAAEVGK